MSVSIVPMTMPSPLTSVGRPSSAAAFHNVSAPPHLDDSIRFQCPFIEGGQGIFTAMAQIVGEELDADPGHLHRRERARRRMSYNGHGIGHADHRWQPVRAHSYPTMRRLGALARGMLLQAAAQEDGRSGRRTDDGARQGRPCRLQAAHCSYGELAPRAMDPAGARA